MARLLATYDCLITIETEITDDQLNALLQEDEIACILDVDALSSVYNLQLLLNGLDEVRGTNIELYKASVVNANGRHVLL